jgi:phosphoribosylformylglycinamidine cyclo-ligase
MKKQSGVDLDLGNRCSKNAYQWAKSSFKFRQGKAGEALMNVDDSFANILQFPGCRLGISSDGIGTKIELAERTGIYDTLGYDLVAMVADDLAANGLEATNISNIIDVDFLDYEIIDSLMKGLYEAAEECDLAISGGEIAELGGRIKGYGSRMHFNWCSTAIGILPQNLTDPIDGSEIADGDLIISLKSRGFRSNGFSLIRKIMQDNFGDNWHLEKYDSTKTWGEILLTPSLIYNRLITKIIAQNIKLKGIVHVTGGGIPDNLARILQGKNLGAEFTSMPEVPAFVEQVKKLGNIPDKQAYRLWNMGNGMLLVCEENIAISVLKIISESGFAGKIAGKIVQGNNISLQIDEMGKIIY